MHSVRIRRAADLAHVTGYPLVIHDRDVLAARFDAITASREGLRVVVNVDVDEPAIVVHAGRFPLDRVCQMPPDPSIARAQESLYRRGWTDAGCALLARAKDRLAPQGFRGRDHETAKVVARAVAGLMDAPEVHVQHVAEALSFRRVYTREEPAPAAA